MTTATATTDGRRARRERGRLAVTDAMIDLVLDGQAPDVDLLTERAGVSEATLYRYFETLDELRGATMARFLVRYADLFEVPSCGEGPLAERIDRFVTARLHLLDTTEPMARFTRTRVLAVPQLGAELHHLRMVLAEQVRRHFATELDALTPARRDDVVAVICTLTSYESWLQLRDDHGRGPQQVRRAMTTTLRCLLDPR
jgi:AcrR family transcriptional regulator